MTPEQFSKQYLSLINNDYKGINLTAIKEYEDFHVKQTEDSILPLQFKEIYNLIDKVNMVVDVGFGGGFPLLAAANEFQGKDFFGIDARKKKVKVVKEIAEKLNIKNVSTYHGRIENIDIDLPVIITVKAVGDISKVLNMINCIGGVSVVFYKGKNIDEKEPKENRYDQWSWSQVYSKTYKLSNGEQRCVLVYKKNNVPRGTMKKLVKLSELT